jgi:hypothetical protein
VDAPEPLENDRLRALRKVNQMGRGFVYLDWFIVTSHRAGVDYNESGLVRWDRSSSAIRDVAVLTTRQFLESGFQIIRQMATIHA